MSTKNDFQRFASLNEQRTISREDLGFYDALLIGGIYDLGPGFDPTEQSSFYYPLRRCIEEHPFMGVVVGDKHTDKAFYERVPTINLRDHIFLEPARDENDLVRIENFLGSNLETPFPPGIPPWRIIVVPLQRGCFVVWSYSHTLGDGLSAAAFHRTFLAACRNLSESSHPASAVVQTPQHKLGEQFDTRKRFPISWSYLLSPLIALFLPNFLASLLGLRASYTSTNTKTWTGAPVYFEPGLRSKVRLQEIEAPLLAKAVQASRKHEARLTGVFHQMIVRALSRAVPDAEITNFVSGTSVNMRKSTGFSMDEMGEFVTGCDIKYTRADPTRRFGAENWEAARTSTLHLATAAATLQDQPIGLLRYLPSIRKWLDSKHGQQRDSSFEISNIGVIEGRSAGEKQVELVDMIFAQPGHITTTAMTFNLTSVKGGSLFYTVTWRTGSLGISGDEEKFVDGICESIRQDLENLE
ncbi:hypothetical protein GQ53DRAFT_880718 [Thozetella sp. PMI_491]|nr:hypothetical protein GQ53DRAFT_880718 [Thozetella sp. PMI_491]